MPLDFPDQRCVPYFRDEIDAKNVCNSYPGQCKESFLNSRILNRLQLQVQVQLMNLTIFWLKQCLDGGRLLIMNYLRHFNGPIE